MSVLLLQFNSPQQAVPIVYEPRPPLLQVDAKAIAKELLNKKQYGCLAKLLGKESAWKSTAKNPTSSASGIGQLLSSTYKNLGMRKTDAGVSQLVATLAYISRRHLHPCGALKHFQNKGWY